MNTSAGAAIFSMGPAGATSCLAASAVAVGAGVASSSSQPEIRGIPPSKAATAQIVRELRSFNRAAREDELSRMSAGLIAIRPFHVMHLVSPEIEQYAHDHTKPRGDVFAELRAYTEANV